MLEYVAGELFNYIVQHGKMKEDRARKFFQQLISGIDYSHRLKVVHRDLKPENVLLDDDLNVRPLQRGQKRGLELNLPDTGQNSRLWPV